MEITERTPKTTPRNRTGMDLSSICNYADESTPKMKQEQEQFPGSIIRANSQICSEEFAYRDEAIPFITVSEETSK